MIFIGIYQQAKDTSFYFKSHYLRHIISNWNRRAEKSLKRKKNQKVFRATIIAEIAHYEISKILLRLHECIN